MLLQAVDTVYVAAPRDSLAVLADWALVVVAAALVVAVIMVAVLTARAGRAVRDVGRLAGRKADPVLERSRAVAANLEFITGTLRHDVEGLHGAIGSLRDRLQLASDRMEERIEEFNALMEVVQGETEEVLLDTVATARGVRAGARELVQPGSRSPAPPPLPDPDSDGV